MRMRRIIITGIFIVVIIGLSIFLLFGRKGKVLVCSDIPYDSTVIPNEKLTDKYKITMEISDSGETDIFISTINGDKKINLFSDPLILEKPYVHYDSIKVDGDVIYYLVDDIVTGSSIMRLDINSYTYEEVYRSKARINQITLFNVPLVTKINSIDVSYYDKINDFILAGNCIILIKSGYVSLFDGREEKIIIDRSINRFKYQNRTISYEDWFGNVYEVNIDYIK